MTCSPQLISPFPIAWVNGCCAKARKVEMKRQKARVKIPATQSFLFIIVTSSIPSEIKSLPKIFFNGE
jgi:hypothetical protein